jgi:hypothetical protein
LDEKAMEAVAKWRFKPGLKDGNPVAVQVRIEVNLRLLLKDAWISGPMAFAPLAGLTPPQVKDGTMPALGGELSNESVVLEFTVDLAGSVKNIHPISGSEAASELLTRSLATWKFQPAVKDSQPAEAVGRVRFISGSGDGAERLPLWR